jgi:hypothetical protein
MIHLNNIGKKKGTAIFIALLTVFIVTLLANAVLVIMTSQSRFTYHQVSRIQAYYAAQAGMVYAYESIRRGDWQIPQARVSYQRSLCNSRVITCSLPTDIVEQDLPRLIDRVFITVSGRNAILPTPPYTRCTPPAGVPVCIHTEVEYTAPWR